MKGWRFLKLNRRRGVSMVLVLCVSAFFVSFAAAMVYATGMVTAQSNQRLKEERCYQLAKSYGKVLTKELTKYEKKTDDSGNNLASGSFYSFANKFLDSSQYLEYNLDYSSSTTYNFVLDDANLSDLFKSPLKDSSYGNITISLKKETNSDENTDALVKGGEIDNVISSTDYTSTITSIENTTVRQYNLILDVTSYYEDVSYTYSLEFAREEKYSVRFKYEDTAIVWDGTNKVWREGNTAGVVCTIPEGATITYEYLTSSSTLSRFIENSLEEGGASGD